MYIIFAFLRPKPNPSSNQQQQNKNPQQQFKCMTFILKFSVSVIKGPQPSSICSTRKIISDSSMHRSVFTFFSHKKKNQGGKESVGRKTHLFLSTVSLIPLEISSLFCLSVTVKMSALTVCLQTSEQKLLHVHIYKKFPILRKAFLVIMEVNVRRLEGYV